ncbi:MAG: FG-GAP repeat domain-containing protein [Planctomycetota bacterium JB042]
MTRTTRRKRIGPVAAMAAAVAAGLVACAEPPVDRAFPAGPLVGRSTVALAHRADALALHDVDGDGVLDAVVGGDAVDVLLGDGEGGFRRAPGAPLEGPVAAIDFAFGDLDGDGRTDLVVAEHHEPRFFVWLGGEEGRFRPAPTSPVTVAAVPHLHAIALVDLDGDGALDVVTDSWPESRLVLVRGRGDGTFEAPGTTVPVPDVPIVNLRAGDLDGDGVPEIVTPAHDHRAVTVLAADGAGGLRETPGSPFPSFGGFSRVALADMDRDGDLDVVVVHRSDASTEYTVDALSVLANDGAGRLAHAPGSPHFELSGRAAEVAVGDVDGDGRPDAAVLTERTRVVALFLGGPDGLRLAGTHPAGGRPRDVAVGDLDGDGRAEVLVTDEARGALTVFGLPAGG